MYNDDNHIEEVFLMRIERVNDSTIKLFITYQDIEKRGYKKEDLWTNRKKGEEFFWSLMDEVDHAERDSFNFEGPLWIQVHAFDKGVEVVVTKRDDEDFSVDMTEEIPEEKELMDLIQESENNNFRASQASLWDEPVMIQFDDFDDLIRYSYQADIDELKFEDLLLTYNNKYYYQMYINRGASYRTIEGLEAKVLEFGSPSEVSYEVVDEYGTAIMSHNVRRQIKKYFEFHK